MATTRKQDALRFDQKVVRGDRFYRSYAFRNDEEVPIDISGFSFQGKIKETFGSADSIDFIISKAQSDEALALGIVADTVIINLPGPSTNNVEAGSYVYDIQKVMDSDPDFVETFLRGNFFILPEVTR